jgi:hypothetical protein
VASVIAIPCPGEPSFQSEGEPMNKEKRKHTRLAIHSKANIKLRGKNIEAASENVSLNGAFVTAVGPVKLNDVVGFNFSDLPISAKAKVVRVTDEGMGLEFEKTLLD